MVPVLTLAGSAVVREGSIVEQGTHNELIAKPNGAYSVLVGLQMTALGTAIDEGSSKEDISFVSILTADRHLYIISILINPPANYLTKCNSQSAIDPQPFSGRNKKQKGVNWAAISHGSQSHHDHASQHLQGVDNALFEHVIFG